MVRDGGYMYIDKFKDSERSHREKLATIKVGSREEDLLFSSDRSKGDGMRRVFIERTVGDDVISKTSRITYDLSGAELIDMAKKAGFSEVNLINDAVDEEKHFDAWLAKK